MRIRKLICLLAAAAVALCGCQVSGEVENQAYVLVLGIDTRASGSLELTARVPRIGKGKPDEAGGGDYLLFSAAGGDWPRALDALEQVTPRQMNLSHIEMIVASETVARSDGFERLVAQVAETPHLYTTARFVVCDGRASDFISAQQTVIGTRLSSELRAMLDHYARQGYIPDASFADAWYLGNSIYGDAVAIRAELAPSSDDAPAVSMIDPVPPTDDGAQSPMRQRYSGTVLFRQGRMAGTLDAGQTRLLNLIRGSVDAFPFECDGRAYTLTPEGRARLGVKFTGSAARLTLDMTLSTLDDVCAGNAARLQAQLAQTLTRIIRACQRLGAEPFGFSEVAAGRFVTVPEWQDCGWRERYGRAEVTVSVRIKTRGDP